MVKPKRRNNKNRPTSRLMPQQHPHHQLQFSRSEFDQDESTMHPTSSPFQPLNMFFNRSRNTRYAAIPEVSSQCDPVPPYFTSRSTGGGGERGALTTREGVFYDNNVLINMTNNSSNHQNHHGAGGYEDEIHSHHGTNSSSSGANTLNNNSKASSTTPSPLPPGLNNLYNSDADTAGSRQDSIEGDVCFPTVDDKDDQKGIDFDALEEYIQEEQRNHHNEHHPRRRRLSNMISDTRKLGSWYGDRLKHQQEETDVYRFTYYSPSEPSTIHARSISEIPSNGDQLSTMIKKGCFWIDVLCPTDAEMKAFSKIFHIHPLTAEDITMEEPREKCEVFKNYYFICFRSFDQDQYSINYLQPIGMYIIILKEGILTFHFRNMPHPYSVRKRIKQLKDYINVTPDWICYAILDDITDSFAPLIRMIEFEVDSIDELVLILKESEQSDMLRRIGYCRKRMMGLLRLLVSKADVIKTMIKRGESKATDGTRPALSSEVALYLGDVQDHIITMLQSLNHYEKISSRSHSNYLAQISIEMTQTNNEINDVLSKLTALGSVLIPMNLVTGLWGMNVIVPGQFREDLTWFFCIMCSILTFCVLSTLLMRYYKII